MGLLKFTPGAWQEIQRLRGTLSSSKKDKLDMTGALKMILNTGTLSIGTVPYQEAWGEIDSADDLACYI